MASRVRVAVLLVFGLLSGQDGADIANDPTLFSETFRAEFSEMNQIFADFGFELEVIGERPPLSAIIDKYGEPARNEDVDVVLGSRDGEARVTLTFYYFRDIGFGVRPDDADRLVMMVKRREG